MIRSLTPAPARINDRRVIVAYAAACGTFTARVDDIAVVGLGCDDDDADGAGFRASYELAQDAFARRGGAGDVLDALRADDALAFAALRLATEGYRDAVVVCEDRAYRVD